MNDGRYTENGKFLFVGTAYRAQSGDRPFPTEKQQNHISEGEAGYDLLNNRKLSDSTVEDRMISDQIAEDVRKLVDFLPAEQKRVVLMRYYMGLSFKGDSRRNQRQHQHGARTDALCADQHAQNDRRKAVNLELKAIIAGVGRYIGTNDQNQIVPMDESYNEYGF